MPAIVVASLAALALVALPVRSASAVDHDKGLPGFCPDGVGVTVVVDFGQLTDGPAYVRCFPSAVPGTGLDALEGAGFQIAGAQRWGKSLVCRIENRPAATEALPVEGSPGYREACVNTPPATAYWSYWWAGNGCEWRYSQWGLKNRNFLPGGFEGWSFSLNATADTNPAPRVAPVRPGTEGHPCTTGEEPAPDTPTPEERLPPTTAARSDPGGAPSGARPAETGAAPVSPDMPGDAPPTPRSSASDPADPGATPTGTSPHAPGTVGSAPTGRPDDEVAFTGGEAAADVDDLLRQQSGSSPGPPVVAVIVVAGLTGGALVVARRRRPSRQR